jgi:hypothetical protein
VAGGWRHVLADWQIRGTGGSLVVNLARGFNVIFTYVTGADTG